MSEITDWEPLAGKSLNASDYVLSLQPPTDDSQPETYWQRQYGKALTQLEEVLFEVEDLKKQVKELSQKNASLLRDIKELQDKFTCFKADAITSLKAIDLCIIATITTQSQVLTHRQRNFRMRHIHQIIVNEVADFSDRKLITYEDDF
jgi:hypothetical protein